MVSYVTLGILSEAALDKFVVGNKLCTTNYVQCYKLVLTCCQHAVYSAAHLANIVCNQGIKGILSPWDERACNRHAVLNSYDICKCSQYTGIAVYSNEKAYNDEDSGNNI